MKKRNVSFILLVCAAACGIFTLLYAMDDAVSAAVQLVCIALSSVFYVCGVRKKADAYYALSALFSVIACLPAIATLLILLLALLKSA